MPLGSVGKTPAGEEAMFRTDTVEHAVRFCREDACRRGSDV